MIVGSGFGILAIYSLLSKGFLLQIGPSHRWDYSSSKEGEMAERSAAIYSSSIVSKGLLFFPLLPLPSSSLAMLDTGDFISDLRLAADLTDGATP